MNERANKSPLDYCDETIDGFKKKASHNKAESLWCFKLVMAFTLAAPLFVTLGNGFVLAKVVPSVLSVLAAFATAWLQLRKPQQLWALYRTCQRDLEDHRTKYFFKVGEYGDTNDPDNLLARNVADISLDAHYKWLPIVPNPEALQEVVPPKKQ